MIKGYCRKLSIEKKKKKTEDLIGLSNLNLVIINNYQ